MYYISFYCVKQQILMERCQNFVLAMASTRHDCQYSCFQKPLYGPWRLLIEEVTKLMITSFFTVQIKHRRQQGKTHIIEALSHFLIKYWGLFWSLYLFILFYYCLMKIMFTSGKVSTLISWAKSCENNTTAQVRLHEF